MRWRPGHLLFLVFQLVWLNVIVPGHTRGSIPLAGSACAGPACCREGKHSGSVPVKAQGCAICYFAAQLSVPPAIVCSPPPLAPLACVERERGESLIGRFTLLPFDSRGPPAVG